MKDSIQDSGSDVAIVIYDSPLPPRYFRLSKKFIKTLFVVVPTCLILSFAILFAWGMGTHLSQTKAPNFPSVPQITNSKTDTLEAENKNLRESIDQLTKKLSAAPTASSSEDPYLMVIKKPFGMQNFLSQNKVSLDQFELAQDNSKIGLKFQIISNTPETKVTGHVLVFMISPTGLMAYPADANASLQQGLKYSHGEPFSVSRLRPTNAEFMIKASIDSVKFVIYIFSREGDLLLIKETDSFKVKAK
ncbi:MAG: hypothetical protein AB7I27_03040 [Bacteriovoracaceae bacterium]